MDTESFRTLLLEWHAGHHRPMPWKGIRDPYRIWLSEVILQQTRVEQGRPYYERFVHRFPGVKELADAADDEVFKLWEGLGYYRRARHMLETARRIAYQEGGRFPDTYQGLLQLKGVGPYSAAAIASFAYDLPHAVVDGNVIRVLARVFGIEDSPATARGRKQFQQLAQDLLDPDQPGNYNQAIMDFGASVCTPKSPACSGCPFRTHCSAFRTDRVQALPQKPARADRKKRFFHYLVLRYDQQVFIRQRKASDIWEGLYEFPLLERNTLSISPGQLLQPEDWQSWGWQKPPALEGISPPFQQTLSHQLIHARFWEYDLRDLPHSPPSSWILVDRKKLPTFAWPKLLNWYFRDNSLYLKLA